MAERIIKRRSDVDFGMIRWGMKRHSWEIVGDQSLCKTSQEDESLLRVGDYSTQPGHGLKLPEKRVVSGELFLFQFSESGPTHGVLRFPLVAKGSTSYRQVGESSLLRCATTFGHPLSHYRKRRRERLRRFCCATQIYNRTYGRPRAAVEFRQNSRPLSFGQRFWLRGQLPSDATGCGTCEAGKCLPLLQLDSHSWWANIPAKRSEICSSQSSHLWRRSIVMSEIALTCV
jgi:hypothetical protein